MSAKKYKKVNAYTKAKILVYVSENWDGEQGKDAKDCLIKSVKNCKKDFSVLSVETGTSAASIELNVKRITSEIYKELYGNYPTGGIMKDDHNPIKWHKKLVETLIEEGLVS